MSTCYLLLLPLWKMVVVRKPRARDGSVSMPWLRHTWTDLGILPGNTWVWIISAPQHARASGGRGLCSHLLMAPPYTHTHLHLPAHHTNTSHHPGSTTVDSCHFPHTWEKPHTVHRISSEGGPAGALICASDCVETLGS